MNQTTLSMADRAYNLIEEMIVTCVLAPGTVFSENELSKTIEIGRTPMREALQRLSGEQLLKAMPRRGMMVSEINIASYLRILETRRVLDRLLAGRAARRADDKQKAALAAIANDIINAAERADMPAFIHVDRELDELLADASRNPYAARANSSLHAHCRRFWFLNHRSGDLCRSAQLHAALVTAVATGDEAASEAASDRLMDYLEEFTKATLKH